MLQLLVIEHEVVIFLSVVRNTRTPLSECRADRVTAKPSIQALKVEGTTFRRCKSNSQRHGLVCFRV